MERRPNAGRLRNEFPNKHLCLVSISRLFKFIHNDETCDKKCGSRRLRSVRTSANIEQVEGIIYCQDDMPDSHMRLVKFMLSAYAMADTFSVLFETLYNLSDKSVTQLSNMYNVM